MKFFHKFFLITLFSPYVYSCISKSPPNTKISNSLICIMPISGFTRFSIDSTNICDVCKVQKHISDSNRLLVDIEKWMKNAEKSNIDSFSFKNLRAIIKFKYRENKLQTMQVDVSGKILWKNEVYVLDKRGLYILLSRLSTEEKREIIRKMPMNQWNK